MTHPLPRVRRPVARVAAVALALGATLAGCADPTTPEARTATPPAATATWSVGPSAAASQEPPPRFRGNPFAEGDPFASPQTSGAAEAAMATGDPERRDILERLAQVPTATWLLPEVLPPGTVGPHVAELVRGAAEVGQVPVLVLYGIPGRDCIHGHSGGGLAPADYPGWVREVAESAGPRAVVVLEPDALASLEACGDSQQRAALLTEAIAALAAGPTTYVDAGHSGWLDAATTARLLRRVGADRVRGFSLNVAGFGDEAEERRHGEQVAALLGTSHFVVDTGRSGNGSDGTWCNPSGRALGALPGLVPGQGPMDARLWVKPPGESDGHCGGGPAAGIFWADAAVEMARAAGW